jgi:hypothetical protein
MKFVTMKTLTQRRIPIRRNSVLENVVKKAKCGILGAAVALRGPSQKLKASPFHLPTMADCCIGCIFYGSNDIIDLLR